MDHKFEIVTACVNHSHFLQETLPINKEKVDNVIIVTSPSDLKTIEVCEQNEVECVQTTQFYKDGAHFNRGLALNEAFKKLKHNDWVLHIDSDIILPRPYDDIFSQQRKKNDLNVEALYGTRRVEISDRGEYLALLKEFAFKQRPKPIGSFIDAAQEIGCGFFQLFNMNAQVLDFFKGQSLLFAENIMEDFKKFGCPNMSNVAKKAGDIYPSFYSCGGSDVHFRSIWPNVFEIPIPVFHLGDKRDHTGRKIFEF